MTKKQQLPLTLRADQLLHIRRPDRARVVLALDLDQRWFHPKWIAMCDYVDTAILGVLSDPGLVPKSAEERSRELLEVLMAQLLVKCL